MISSVQTSNEDLAYHNITCDMNIVFAHLHGILL